MPVSPFVFGRVLRHQPMNAPAPRFAVLKGFVLVCAGLFQALCLAVITFLAAVLSFTPPRDASDLAFFSLLIFGAFNLYAVNHAFDARNPRSTWLAMICLDALLLLIPVGGFSVAMLAHILGGAPTGQYPMFFMGGVGGLGIASLGYSFSRRPRITETIRGRELIELSEIERRIAKLTPPHAQLLSWGGIKLPERFSENHFCIVGATGSGKTATITHLLHSVLSSVTSGQDTRVVIYDAKRDICSVLHALGVPEERIVMMNPLDSRSAPWDVAADVDEPLLTHQIASIIIPSEQGQNKYFSDAGRDLVAGVMKALMLTCPKRSDGVPDWTFRDVLMSARNESRLRAVLSRCPATSELIEQYFGGGVTFDNIKSTIASNVAMLEPIAALWAKSDVKPVSLRRWCNTETVLVVGNDDSLRAPLDAVNRVIFQRLFELILGQGDSATRRTWFFLDELKEAGQIAMLPRLLNKGRSVGARVVIGFQDLGGLYHLYGHDLAGEIVGMCGNKALLRVDSDVTATWASSAIGEAEVREFSRSESFGREASFSVSEHIKPRQLALRDELKDLPVPQDGVFDGYYITPAVGVFRNKVRVLPLDRGRTDLNFQPRPVEHQYLDGWAEGDWRRLGHLTAPEAPPEARQLHLELDAIRRMERPTG